MTIDPNQPDNHLLKLNLPFSASNGKTETDRIIGFGRAKR